MSGLDWAIIAIYLLGVVGLGIAAGFLRRKNEIGGEGGHYFLAGNTLSAFAFFCPALPALAGGDPS